MFQVNERPGCGFKKLWCGCKLTKCEDTADLTPVEPPFSPPSIPDPLPIPLPIPVPVYTPPESPDPPSFVSYIPIEAQTIINTTLNVVDGRHSYMTLIVSKINFDAA